MPKLISERGITSAIMQYGIGVFYMWGSEAPRWQKLQCFAKAYDRIVEKEASESQYWLELLEEAKIGDNGQRSWLVRECGELVAVFTAIGRTAKSRRVAKRQAKN